MSWVRRERRPRYPPVRWTGSTVWHTTSHTGMGAALVPPMLPTHAVAAAAHVRCVVAQHRPCFGALIRCALALQCQLITVGVWLYAMHQCLLPHGRHVVGRAHARRPAPAAGAVCMCVCARMRVCARTHTRVRAHPTLCVRAHTIVCAQMHAHTAMRAPACCQLCVRAHTQTRRRTGEGARTQVAGVRQPPC